MKKIIYLLAFLLAAYQMTNAQVVIGDSHKYAVGDFVTSYDADTANITEGQSGANRTWNFANITGITQSITTEIVSPAGTPYSSSFPDANICQKVNTGSGFVYSYNKQSASDNNFLGQGFDQTTIVYNNPELMNKFPFSYQSTYTDTYSAVYQIEDIDVHHSGDITTTADAYGTITLPSGTYSALRLKVVTNTVDSSFIQGMAFVSKMENTSYVWYTSQYKFAVFSIGYTKIRGIAGSFESKSVGYSTDQSTGVSQLGTSLPEDFKLNQNYPNPFNPSTKINYSLPENGFVKLTVFDAAGRLVTELVNDYQRAGEYQVDFVAAGLSSGAYFYKLQSGAFSDIKKMMLIK